MTNHRTFYLPTMKNKILEYKYHRAVLFFWLIILMAIGKCCHAQPATPPEPSLYNVTMEEFMNPVEIRNTIIDLNTLIEYKQYCWNDSTYVTNWITNISGTRITGWKHFHHPDFEDFINWLEKTHSDEKHPYWNGKDFIEPK